MLAPVLVTEDPYAAASVFCQAGWKLEYETPRVDGAPRACVSLAQARVVLVTPQSTTQPRQQDALPRGRGVVLQLHAPPHELSGLFLLHRATGLAISEPARQPSGERGFRAEIVGYQFLIIAGDPDPDLALISTDPRIAALADGLRQRDGAESLTDTALRLAESSGESVRRLRRAMSQGLDGPGRTDVAAELAEVQIAAAILARQLGVDLTGQIESKLGRRVSG